VPLHRGKVLVRSMLRLASGADSHVEIEHLEAQGQLFGSTLSDSTMFWDFSDLRTSGQQTLLSGYSCFSLSNNRVPFLWT
jgi:hypothetical protein